MISVRCRTNLDLVSEEWPREMPTVPSVGDEIQSRTKHGDFQLCLQVVAIRWEHDGSPYEPDDYIPHIELHMTEFQKLLPSKTPGAATGLTTASTAFFYEWRAAAGSITAFYEWYAPLVGRSVSSFI